MCPRSSGSEIKNVPTCVTTTASPTPTPAPLPSVITASATFSGIDASTLQQHLPELASAIAASVGVSASQVNITSVTSARRALGARGDGGGDGTAVRARKMSGGGSVVVQFTVTGNATAMASVVASIGAALETPAFAAAVTSSTGVQITVTGVQAVIVTPMPTPSPTALATRTCSCSCVCYR